MRAITYLFLIIALWLPATMVYSQSYTPVAYSLPDIEKWNIQGNEHEGDTLLYFYNLRGKYPESSFSLAARAQAFIAANGFTFSGSGYIRYGIFVDSTGGGNAQVMNLRQTDNQYKAAWFGPELVARLYRFIHLLDRWNDGASKYYAHRVGYFSFLQFKIQNGRITDVTP